MPVMHSGWASLISLAATLLALKWCWHSSLHPSTERASASLSNRGLPPHTAVRLRLTESRPLFSFFLRLSLRKRCGVAASGKAEPYRSVRRQAAGADRVMKPNRAFPSCFTPSGFRRNRPALGYVHSSQLFSHQPQLLSFRLKAEASAKYTYQD